MRRAAFVLCLFCVSAVVTPVALRAAADTNSRAGVVIKDKAADSLPRATQIAPPGSATRSKSRPADPHPILTEFFGPATSSKPAPAPVPAPVKTAPRAELNAPAK